MDIRELRHQGRVHSTIQLPASKASNAVVDAATYEEGQKTIATLDVILDGISYQERMIDEGDKDERARICRMREELDRSRSRLQNTMERNTSKGALDALADIQSSQSQRLASKSTWGPSSDSGYASSTQSIQIGNGSPSNSSVRSMDFSPHTSWKWDEKFPVPVSRRDSESVVGSWETVITSNATMRVLLLSLDSSTIYESCIANLCLTIQSI